MCLEDARVYGLRKGDIGPFMDSHDTTYKGDAPMNTDGGQLSVGQLNPAGASGGQQIVNAVRQIRVEAGAFQVARNDLGLSNH